MLAEIYAPAAAVIVLSLLIVLLAARRARRHADAPSLPVAPPVTWTPAAHLDTPFTLPRRHADGTWSEIWNDAWGDAR